jgi:hypothetical protein
MINCNQASTETLGDIREGDRGDLLCMSCLQTGYLSEDSMTEHWIMRTRQQRRKGMNNEYLVLGGQWDLHRSQDVPPQSSPQGDLDFREAYRRRQICQWIGACQD